MSTRLRTRPSPMREMQVSVKKREWIKDVRPLNRDGIVAAHVPLPTDGYEFAWQGKAHYLALHDLRLRDGELFTDSTSASRVRDCRGTLSFLPAQCRVWGWGVPTPSQNSFTAIYFDPREMDGELSRRFRDAPLKPLVNFTNPILFSTLAKIRTAISKSVDPDRIYIESLFTLCALEVCQLFLGHHRDTSVGKLSPQQRQRVFDYIETHLASDIGLGELAQSVSLTRFHFIKTFKATTGITPYQYLIKRRIDRACELLEDDVTTTEAAARLVGFSTASLFIRHFKQLKGVTPAVYAQGTRSFPARR